MRKLLSVFLAFTIFVSASTILFGTTEVSAASKTGKRYVTYKGYSKNIKKKGTYILKGKVKYPKLKSKSKAAKKINKIIKKKIKSFTLKIESMAKKEYAENGFKNFKIFLSPFQYNVNYKLTYNKKGKYSFRISQYSYTMGAHGYEHVEGCTFKKSNGKKISNAKVTKYSGEKLKSKIVSKMEKKIAEEPAKYYTWAVNTINNRDINAFNIWLKGKYAYVHFDPYDISSYVAGPTEIKIKL